MLDTGEITPYLPSLFDTNSFRRTQSVKVDGYNLTTAAVVAAARYTASINLDYSKKVKERVDKSRQVVIDKVASGASIYGLSTGFGGSGASIVLP